MRIVSLRGHRSIYLHDGHRGSLRDAEQFLASVTFNSSPINIGRVLTRRGSISSFTEWRFWGFQTNTYSLNGIPVKMLQANHPEDLSEVEKHLAEEGEPEVLWVEGLSLPVTLRRIFELCPNSVKIIYPKYCEPWLIEGLEHYDTCLVDEPWQIDEMTCRHPGVTCHLWDKLVDYDDHFFPTHCPKEYDVCYVARLHPRKYHKLLFSALAKIHDRQLSAVLVGSDENECQKYLEPMAAEAGVKATFTGHLSTQNVNYYINASKVGVLCDKYDAVPRAMLEYMAADIPVLATSEMRAGARYISQTAGLILPPEQFHEGITEILENAGKFSPRKHLLEHYSRSKVVSKLWNVLLDLQAQKKHLSKP